jgi:hypothetical protein
VIREVLLLLLALGMSLVAVLGSILSVLLRGRGVFLALRVIAFAVMLSCGTMRLSRVLVVLGGLVMFVLGHGILPFRVTDRSRNNELDEWFLALIDLGSSVYRLIVTDRQTC